MLRGSVYYYLESKEARLFELMEEVCAGFLAFLEEIRASDDDALVKLRRLVRRHISYLVENRVSTTLFLTEFRSLSEEHQSVVAGHEEGYRRAVQDLIGEGQQEGLVREDVDADVAAMALLGAANWVYRWHGRHGRASSEEIARQFERILGDGLSSLRGAH
jgi:AcrR family transcriptional regulator